MGSSVSYISTQKDIGINDSISKVNKSLQFDVNIESKEYKPVNDGVKPKNIKIDSKFTPNYAITSDLDNIVAKLNESLFIPQYSVTHKKEFETTVNKYNRFKVATPNLALQKGFAHVFFVRPNCNVISLNNKNALSDSIAHNPLFQYTWQHSPKVVKELVSIDGPNHDFMLSLSNAIASFSPSDEYINTDTYGRTYSGYKIAYGQHNVESKTAGEFSVSFNDDRDLHIYQLHRLWVEYISGVFRGTILPLDDNIINKILDYTSACYYIVTAEDGESIIFWSKYYGIFPTNIPSTQYAWGSGNTISNSQIEVTYKYSFKEDFNPYTILEFNYNSRAENGNLKYMPIYDKKLDHVGATWVGAPFIELESDPSHDIYQYKLRFREK